MRLCAPTAAFGLAAAGGLLFASIGSADPPDPPGAARRYFLPIPIPSADTSPQTFVVNGQTNVIPRNYIEGASINDDGTAAAISLRAVLPDFGGLTKETIRCGIGYQDPCSAEVVVIDLTSGPFLTNGPQQLQNIKPISHPDQREGPCGLQYYESHGSTDDGGIVHQFFFTKLLNQPDISVLRCSKPGSLMAPRCNAHDDVGDRNSVYYNFDRGRLCEWGAIRRKSFALI